MAVADVAVRIGPRNRRRIGGALLGLGALAALVVAVALLTRPAGQGTSVPGVGHSVGKTDNRYLANWNKLVFGMTKQQVRKLVGEPSAVAGRCWLYVIDEAYPPGKLIWNKDKVCFAFGRYAERHGEFNGVWGPTPPLPFLPRG